MNRGRGNEANLALEYAQERIETFRDILNRIIDKYEGSYIHKGRKAAHPRSIDITNLRTIIAREQSIFDLVAAMQSYLNNPANFKYAKLSPLRTRSNEAILDFLKVNDMHLIDAALQLRQHAAVGARIEDAEEQHPRAAEVRIAPRNVDPQEIARLREELARTQADALLLEAELAQAREYRPQPLHPEVDRPPVVDPTENASAPPAVEVGQLQAPQLPPEFSVLNDALLAKNQEVQVLEARLREKDEIIREHQETIARQQTLIEQLSSSFRMVSAKVRNLMGGFMQIFPRISDHFKEILGHARSRESREARNNARLSMSQAEGQPFEDLEVLGSSRTQDEMRQLLSDLDNLAQGIPMPNVPAHAPVAANAPPPPVPGAAGMAPPPPPEAAGMAPPPPQAPAPPPPPALPGNKPLRIRKARDELAANPQGMVGNIGEVVGGEKPAPAPAPEAKESLVDQLKKGVKLKKTPPKPDVPKQPEEESNIIGALSAAMAHRRGAFVGRDKDKKKAKEGKHGKAEGIEPDKPKSGKWK